MGDFKERVKYRDQDDLASKGWGEAKASPFNPNGITLSLNSGWGQAAGWGNTGFDGGMDEGGMDDFTLHSPLPALTPKPAATLINAHSLMLDSLMQGKKLAGTKYLPGQVLEDADLLTHSLALQKQADEAAGVNQTAASNLKPLLQKHQTLASSATLPQQQAWHLHKGLQLLQDARDEGIVPGEDAERLGDSFKRSLAQDQANLLLNKAPHAIAQALHTNPLLVGLNEQDRQRLEQRAERRLHSLPLDQQHQQQQALLHQTGNHLKNWFTRSYDYLGKAGQLSPSELADLELTQALPQHTLNLLAQLSAHAVKQSAKHQAYLNRIQQGFKDQPLDPHNPDDQQAADYHFLLNHGKDSDQQLAGTLPDLFRLTGIVPKSAKPALSRLVHGRDGVKFSQRLADVWQSNPSLAAQLPDEVLAHNFAASTLLPDWQLGGAADPHNRLYYLLTSPALPPVPTSQDPAILGQQTAQRIIALRQLQDDLKTLEYQAAHHPDQMVQARLQPLIQARRDTLAQLSADPQNNVPQNLRIISLTTEQLYQQLRLTPGDGAFASPSFAAMPRLPVEQRKAWGLLGGIPKPDRDQLYQVMYPGFSVTTDAQGQRHDTKAEKLIAAFKGLTPEQLQQLAIDPEMGALSLPPGDQYLAKALHIDPALAAFLTRDHQDDKYMSNATRNLLVQMTGQDPKALGLPEEGTAGFMDSRPATVHFLSLLNQSLKLYQTHQISYPQLLQTWNSLQFFRIDQSDDTLDRLVSPGQPNPGFLTPDMLDKLASVAADLGAGALSLVNWGLRFLGPMAMRTSWAEKMEKLSPLADFEEIRNSFSGLIPRVEAETAGGRISYQMVSAILYAALGGFPAMLAAGAGAGASQAAAELGAPPNVQMLLDFIIGHKLTQAPAPGSLGKLPITNNSNLNLNIHPSQGNTNIPTNPGNGLPNTATTPGNITTSGNITTPGNPATALNPGAVTPGNNIGNQPLNPANQLAKPNNSLTPGPANLANQPPLAPGQQATTPSTSKTPLQNTRRTVYSIHDIPSIHDNTPIVRRPLPNYTPEQLEIYRNHTSDWHTRDDWPVEVMDLVGGHGTKHVYDGPKATADRILNPQPGDRVPTASTHTFSADHEDYLVKETLRYNGSIIESWLPTVTAGKSLVLKYIPPNGELTGFGIPRGGTHFMPTYKMTVWIVRTQNGYRLFDHFPSFE